MHITDTIRALQQIARNLSGNLLNPPFEKYFICYTYRKYQKNLMERELQYHTLEIILSIYILLFESNSLS